jgi:hypothetical protein
VQVPNVVSNHLTAGLLRYFHTTGRYTSGINLFEKLRTENIEVASLLSKVLFMGNEEVQGIRILHDALKQSPMDYVMLDTQAEFLLKKAKTATTPEQRDERLRMSLGCADRSTIAAPSEFGTWARLAEVYVTMEDWENALTTLNSCPMFTYQDKDAPVMPEPRDIHLPTLQETRLDEIDSEPESRYSEQVDPSLLNLRAAAYRGTFKHAYSILTEMTAKIGWDQLLKIRSNVFVMEDEYREKQESTGYPKNRNASTDALRGTPDPTTNGAASEAGVDEEKEDVEAADKEEKEKNEGEGEGEEQEADNESTANTLVPGGRPEDIERPSSAVDPDEVKKGDDSVRYDFVFVPYAHATNISFRALKKTTSRALTTSASANAGSTACLWCFTRTCAFIPFGARRWLSTARRVCSTKSQPRNGRSWGHWLSACSTSTRPSRPTAPASPSASAPRR